MNDNSKASPELLKAFQDIDNYAAAELARREAQAGPSPAAVGSHAAFNDALMVEAAQKIDELRAENARLRALNEFLTKLLREISPTYGAVDDPAEEATR